MIKKNCLNNKCTGEIELLYDYGNNNALDELNFDCTHPKGSDSMPKIYVCNKCELKFSELAIGISSNVFEDKYKDVVDHVYINELPYKKKYFSNLFRKISSCFDKNKSVLEIGSYYGVFGNIIKPNVKSYSGLELSKHGSDYASKNYNLQIYNETLENHVKRNIKYDIIIMSDVIEHFSDPFTVIELIDEILNEDGLLIFTTFNMDSLYAKITGRNYHWILPFHLFYFSNKTLKSLCFERNLEIFKIKNDTRTVSVYYLLGKLEKLFTKFKFIFTTIKKIKIFNNLNISVNLFDLNIYYAKKITKQSDSD